MKRTLLLLLFLPFAVSAQPSNDNCSNAIALSAGTNPVNGTNVLATIEAFESAAPANQGCWASAPDATVWYTFTPTSTGTFTVSLDNRLSDATTPDSQIKLFTGSCGTFTLTSCSEDNGVATNLAGAATAALTAGTTYYIQVDLYGTTAGAFSINIFQNKIAANDCVLNAIDVTSFITPLSPANPFTVAHNFVFNPPGGTAALDAPTRQDITGDYNGCNGYNLPLTRNPDHKDVWFKFTVTSSTPAAYVQLFPVDPGYPVSWAMGLYSGTPAGVCSTGNISGLTFVDCSCGVLVDVPPGNEKGFARDEALCSTPVHPRVDISGLSPGQYYLRVWDYAGGVADEGFFNLGFESVAPRANTSDTCSNANIGYTGPVYNVDVNATYPGLSNAGTHGNACNTATNEPLLGATPAGESRDGCTGPWIIYPGTINNVMNLTTLHTFTVNACPGCAPTAIIRLDNIANDGTFANVPQLQVMAPNNCTGSVATIMNGVTRNTCIEMRVASNAPLINGDYYVVIDGQDGQLLKYDLTLTLNYPCDSSTTCLVLPVDLLSFTGENKGNSNRLHWITASEINNEYFEIEKRHDTEKEFVMIHRMEGAGNSSQQNEYVTNDYNVKDGVSYYRLKQVDFDGHFKYSNTIAIYKGEKENNSIYSIRPDVDKIEVGYYSNTAGSISWNVLSMDGKVISEGRMEVTKNMNQLTLPAVIPNGLYVINISSADGQIESGRFASAR